MDTQHRPKVQASAKAGYHVTPSSFRPPSRDVSRPNSPTKLRPIPQSSLGPSPPLRTTVKVNNSANINGGNARNLSNATNTTSTTTTTANPRLHANLSPRSPSPFKYQESRSGRSSPVSKVPHARVTLARPMAKVNSAAASVPSTPHVTTFLSPATSDTALATPSPRRRHVSISSSSQFSTSSSLSNIIQPQEFSPLSIASSPPFTDTESQSSSNPVRVTAKVSGLAKAKPQPLVTAMQSVSVSPPSPAPSSTSRYPRIARTPSISSLVTNQNTFYPITTASPAANVHRFATARVSPKSRPYQPFPSSTDLKVPTPFRPLTSYTPHVDPALVPLPPQSPPTSTVSFSSVSSASRSPVSAASRSAAPTLNRDLGPLGGAVTNAYDHMASRGSVDGGRSRAGSFVVHDSQDGSNGRSGEASEAADEDRKVRAEAKSNRKIADLEITNKSLLAINSTLEATKHRQAKEIRDLRRRLRESRLILPPIAYRAVKSSLLSDEDDDDDDGEDEAEDEPPVNAPGKEGAIFERVKGMIEAMLETGQKALDAKSEDFAEGKGGAKVLHEVEVRSWRRDGREQGSVPNWRPGPDESFVDESFVEESFADESFTGIETEDDGANILSRLNADNDLDSENEVELMMSHTNLTPSNSRLH